MKLSKSHCTIYIVRHGESEWNVKGLIQGQSDSLLTIEGEKQALLLSKELKNIMFDAIYSSDLVRAKRTADILAIKRNLSIQTSKALLERNFGQLEGKSGKHIKILAELQKRADKIKFKTFGIESDEKIVSRMFTFLREIAVAYLGKTVLVVTHGSLVRVLIVHLGYATLDQLPPFSVGNTAVVKLESDGVDFFIRSTKRVNFKL